MGQEWCGGEAAETVHPQSTTRKRELRIETLNQAIAFGTSVAEEHTQDVHSHPIVSPAVTSTAGFLRANIARMSKTRPNPVSQQQQRKFTSMKPTTNNSGGACKSNCKETPACPVVTYLSIVSVFSLIMLTNFQHSPTSHPQTR